jgi:diaminohydroxyphosphoribosylaminopyrimidine deaminase/5-amino-6-(5-phosphoribosylamino)uracil reductase
MVGAVIVKKGRIVGEGYHHYFGGKHAEINAIESARESISGATIYVTLEPCSHYGKTPPCADALVKYKIGRVVIGCLDPNPSVNGRGIEILKQHGIETKTGLLEDECRLLNEAHFKHMITGLPLVTVKFAQTLDGRIATSTGDSRWISSEPSLKLAHKLRTRNDAIIVGAGTVLKDNPLLTVRLTRGKNPVRIILDSRLRTPLDAAILKDQQIAKTLIITTSRADSNKMTALCQAGIEVLTVIEDETGQISLLDALKILGARNITSILVEGGSALITSFLQLNLADKLVAIIAPRLMGTGLETVGDLKITEVSQTRKLNFTRIYKSGNDVVIEAKFPLALQPPRT